MHGLCVHIYKYLWHPKTHTQTDRTIYSLILVSSYWTDLYRFISNWIFFTSCPSHHPSQTSKHLSSSHTCCYGLFLENIFLLSKRIPWWEWVAVSQFAHKEEPSCPSVGRCKWRGCEAWKQILPCIYWCIPTLLSKKIYFYFLKT